jgi:hypothetical protein
MHDIRISRRTWRRMDILTMRQLAIPTPSGDGERFMVTICQGPSVVSAVIKPTHLQAYVCGTVVFPLISAARCWAPDLGECLG